LKILAYQTILRPASSNHMAKHVILKRFCKPERQSDFFRW
jgi:hypothetical protein